MFTGIFVVVGILFCTVVVGIPSFVTLGFVGVAGIFVVLLVFLLL